MSTSAPRLILCCCFSLALGVTGWTATRAPQIWDERALAEWATPIASLKVRPGHYSAADYYAAPSDNLRTYPVYRPDKEPPGWDKIPSLRGLWYRPRLMHDASIVTLEELFEPARLDPEYERKGWSPPGVTKGAIPGLEFLTKLSPEDKRALIAFLRSL
jgi:hypothetical protein